MTLTVNDLAGKTIATSVDVTATNNAEDHLTFARITLTFTDGTSIEIDEYAGDYWDATPGEFDDE